MSKQSRRRGFLHRLTALAAGIGAWSFGLVPEARGAAAATTTTTDPAAPSFTPLAAETQNAFYASALNDPNVSLLLGALPAAGRLDPPQQSTQTVLASGAQPQTVVMPVTSYADGSTLAYLFYGADAPNSLILSAMATNDGKLKLAIGGQIYDSPVPQWNDAYFAWFFPDQYLAADSGTPTALRIDSPARKRRWASVWSSEHMTKTMAVGGDGGVNPGLAPCLANCNLNAKNCLIALGATVGVGALLTTIWCLACLILAGATAVSGGAVVTIALMKACGYACIWAGGLILSFTAGVAVCRGVRKVCIANCNLAFPPLPPPPPPPPPPGWNPVPTSPVGT
jgi:hypothetical protein